jgi:hypothetical protein
MTEINKKLENEKKLYPEPMNGNNVSIIIGDVLKHSVKTTTDVVNTLIDAGDNFAQNIEKHRIEKMIKLGKFKRKDWSVKDIKQEMDRKINEEDKNYFFVKDKHLSEDEIKELVTNNNRFKVETADQDEVIEELYQDKNESNCCKCTVKMGDIKINGIENLKISYL